MSFTTKEIAEFYKTGYGANKEKVVIITVGPMGCGKSTTYNEHFSDYHRISQDEQGQKAHFALYEEALKKGEKRIYVDRIGHTRTQRYKYANIAKENGYFVAFLVMNLPYKVCFERLLKREGHPNLGKGTSEKTIHNALGMYFKQYEYVQTNEGDRVHVCTNYDPYCYTIDFGTRMLGEERRAQRVIIIGDVHGCYDELITLLSRANVQKDDIVIFCGDLFDKGPKIKEVYEYVRYKKNFYSIRGNHEDKLLRYLKGNKVNITHGLEKTIAQLGLEDINSDYAKELRIFLESLPYMINFDDKYIIHGGIIPGKGMTRQPKEVLLYGRNWNPDTKSFNTEGDPYWHTFCDEYDGKDIYFGHQVHEKTHVAKGVYAMDGGCVHGMQLKAAVLEWHQKMSGGFYEQHIISVDALEEYSPRKLSIYGDGDFFTPYEDRVKRGLLRKVVDGDLVLYNYTDKCTFERAWDKYTIESRGIVFNTKTNEVVARPFPKFFNMNERPETQEKKLPWGGGFTVAEKMDGSLGVLYNYKGKWRINTRGSFFSDQAKYAQYNLLPKYDLSHLDPNYTYMVEIIYPGNKIIIDYGDKEELALLGAIHKVTGKDALWKVKDRVELATKTGMCFALGYDYDLETMKKLKHEIDKDDEGWVVRFDNGLRVKIKGEEYCKLSKILSRVSPISLWETMKNGMVDEAYLAQIPEEVYPEFKPYVRALEKAYKKKMGEIRKEFFGMNFDKYTDFSDPKNRKKLAITINQTVNMEHKSIMFAFADGSLDKVDKYIMTCIRPKNNQI